MKPTKEKQEYKNVKTFKVKHGLRSTSFLNMFESAYQIALFSQNQKKLGNKLPTTKHVKHIKLKSEIACQVIRKYFKSKTLKVINKNNIKLIFPGQNLKFNKNKKNIKITSIKTTLNCWFDTTNITKINQIELDKEYAYICCSYQKPETQVAEQFIGIDLNSTSHSIVLANQKTGKVKKYGKSIPHIQRKYKNIRRKLQAKSKISKKLGNRNTNIVNDKLHKIVNSILTEAKSTNCNIKIENLKGIREACTKQTSEFKKFKKTSKKYSKTKNKNIRKENKKTRIYNNNIRRIKENNFTLNSWPFYKFKQILTYKSIMSGIRVIEIDPKYTSQTCSRCGELGKRSRKIFNCANKLCMHTDHADVNAAFEIAKRHDMINSVENEFNGRGDKARSLTLPLTPSSGSDCSQSNVQQFTEPQAL